MRSVGGLVGMRLLLAAWHALGSLLGVSWWVVFCRIRWFNRVFTVMESHGVLNFHSRPGKVTEFRKNCLGHGKVMEFRFFPNSFLGGG